MSADDAIVVLACVIAGGGTGGHLYPGIAVARELAGAACPTRRSRSPARRAASRRGWCRAKGFALDLIRSAGLKGKSLAPLVRGSALLPLGAVDAWHVVSRRRPARGDRRRRLQLGPGRAARGAARHPDAAARAERGARADQPAARARVVRAAAVTFESTLAFFGEQGVRQRQSGPAGVLRRQSDATRRRMAMQPPSGGAGPDLWRLSGRARDQRGHGGGSAASWQPAGRVWRSRTRRESAIWRWSATATGAPGFEAGVEPFLFAMDRRDDSRRPRRLPRRRDDAGGADGGRPAGDSGSAADGDRRSPAEERRGAGRGGRRARCSMQRELTGRPAGGGGSSRSPTTPTRGGRWRPRRGGSRGPTRRASSSTARWRWRRAMNGSRRRRCARYARGAIHFVGIGGIGMSGIAELLANLGYEVSGSDAKRSAVTDRLGRRSACACTTGTTPATRRRRRRRGRLVGRAADEPGGRRGRARGRFR